MEATFIKRRELTYELWIFILTKALEDYEFYLIEPNAENIEVAQLVDKIEPFSEVTIKDSISTRTLYLEKEMIFAERVTSAGKSVEKLDYVRYAISHEHKIIYVQRRGELR